MDSRQAVITSASVVTGQNFGPAVITYLMVIAVIGLVVLIPTACELEKRMKTTSGRLDDEAVDLAPVS